MTAASWAFRACVCCGTVFRATPPSRRLCSDACQRARDALQHRESRQRRPQRRQSHCGLTPGTTAANEALAQWTVHCTCGALAEFDTDGDGRLLQRCATCRLTLYVVSQGQRCHDQRSRYQAEVSAAIASACNPNPRSRPQGRMPRLSVGRREIDR